MTAHDNPNPFPLAQKLWTVKEEKIPGCFTSAWLVKERNATILRLHVNEWPVEHKHNQWKWAQDVANAHNASLAIPKQEEREKIMIRNLKLLDDIHRAVMRHSGNRELADSVWCLLRPDQGMAATAPPTQYKHLESETPVASQAEDGQTQKSLSVVLDEIERRENSFFELSEELLRHVTIQLQDSCIQINPANVYPVLRAAFAKLLSTQNPALVKALRRAIDTIQYHGGHVSDCCLWDIADLLTSPAETKKNL